MSSGRLRSRAWRIAGAALGVALAGTAVGVAHHRRTIAARRGAGDRVPLGSLRSTALTVVTPDGVPLHVEVDEYAGGSLDPALDPTPGGRPGAAAPDAASGEAAPPLTVVFVHGYALSLDCWHFQRAGYRGLVRSVYYDQRSHGRSGRSDREHSTVDQLGADLAQVLHEVVPEGPVVLVGHSMGGMTIVALAEQHPELFGDKVVGVGLVATTAGRLDVGRILLPFAPARLSSRVAGRTVRVLSRGHIGVDWVRRAGASVAEVATDLFAFGGEVPSSYVRFVDEMLSATPFQVLAAFFPSISDLDKVDAVHVLERVPTTIVCGTDDRLTPFSHSEDLHDRIAGSRLLEVDGAGHMVIMESHEQVNAELDQLLAAAAERVARR